MVDWRIGLLVALLAFVVTHNFGEDAMQSDGPEVVTAFVPNEDVEFVKMNFSQTTISQLNYLIHAHFVDDLFYMNMAYDFQRADVALPGFFKFFRHLSEHRRNDAQKLMRYLNKRGGAISFRRSLKLPTSNWNNGLSAMEACLAHEKELNRKILKMHVTASLAYDPHLTNFLEDVFLEPKVMVIKRLADFVTRLKSFSKDYHLGEYLLDRDLQSLPIPVCDLHSADHDPNQNPTQRSTQNVIQDENKAI